MAMPVQRRHLRLQRRLLGELLAVHGDLPGRRRRLRQRLRLEGTYSGQLTIAAENDIIIDGNLVRTRQRHARADRQQLRPRLPPVSRPRPQRGRAAATARTAPARSRNLRIDAAILAIQHSFIVDHYNCGGPLGNLTVNGAIAQKFRGAVGTFSGSTAGLRLPKHYNYDDRLRYISPPHFLDPVESAWHVQRQTLDFP